MLPLRYHRAVRVGALSWMFKRIHIIPAEPGWLQAKLCRGWTPGLRWTSREAVALQQIHLMSQDLNTEQMMAEPSAARARPFFFSRFHFSVMQKHNSFWRLWKCFSLRLLLVFLQFYWCFIDHISAVSGVRSCCIFTEGTLSCNWS